MDILKFHLWVRYHHSKIQKKKIKARNIPVTFWTYFRWIIEFRPASKLCHTGWLILPWPAVYNNKIRIRLKVKVTSGFFLSAIFSLEFSCGRDLPLPPPQSFFRAITRSHVRRERVTPLKTTAGKARFTTSLCMLFCPSLQELLCLLSCRAVSLRIIAISFTVIFTNTRKGATHFTAWCQIPHPSQRF